MGTTSGHPSSIRRLRHAAVGKRSLLLILALLSGGAILSLPPITTRCLRSAGRFLVVQHPVSKADAIVIAVDVGSAGVLEASDLVHQGVSAKVAVFDEAVSTADREFLRRGLPYEHRTSILIRQLHSLGINSIEEIPQTILGSEQEGEILPAWCKQQGFHTVVLVTSPDHSRRLCRILRRSLKAHSLTIIVRSSSYSDFDPDTWWKSHNGVKTATFEFEKLLVDTVEHPLN